MDKLLNRHKVMEDLPNVATRLKTQILFPTPEIVVIDEFGEPGSPSILLDLNQERNCLKQFKDDIFAQQWKLVFKS